MKELARDNTQLLLNKIWEVCVCPGSVRFFFILSAQSHNSLLSIISSAVQLPIEKRDGLVLAEVSSPFAIYHV